LPSGTFELVFNLADDELRIYKTAGEQCQRYSGAIVSGPYAGSFTTDTAEEASVMGVHFKPGGAFLFLGLPADEFANSHINLEAVWGRAASELRERLARPSTHGARFDLLERALLSRLGRAPQRHYAVSFALHAFAHDGQHSTTAELARQACLSERRFIDVFRLEVGMKPKLFGRIVRFRRMIDVVHRIAAPNWAQLALDSGCFDQSHLIREFLSFSGFSPDDYTRRLNDLRRRGLHVKYNHLPMSR
jgi:AraC-like DNA-binding protein